MQRARQSVVDPSIAHGPWSVPEAQRYDRVDPIAPPDWLVEEDPDDVELGPGLQPLRPVRWEPEYIGVKTDTPTPHRYRQPPPPARGDLAELHRRRTPTVDVPAPPWSLGGLLLTLIGWSIAAAVFAVLVLSWITGELPAL